ncbi:GLPGLI family protein [Hymenobacter sp. UYCo722]|uniref:GLPGLI family protein n=1 Tax=Hymenobacter sp. UYCo722 TaxID=3156335 RepID=UPI003391F5D8
MNNTSCKTQIFFQMIAGKILSFPLFTALLALWGLCANAQSTPVPAACLRGVYQLDYKLDSAVVTPKSVQMILRISNGVSCFQSTGKHIFDSVYVSLKGLAPQERMQKALNATQKAVKNELRYTILKEPTKNLVSYHDIIGSLDYQYQEPKPQFDWKITMNKKTIAGHACQQAYTVFGGRIWETWFTREIPVSEGPYKFYGLPGLIVQVQDTHKNYVFTLLNLDTNPVPFDISVNSGTALSANSSALIIPKTKFEQAKLNDDLTLLDRMSASGNQIPESARANYLGKLKRRNNPLELK